MELTRWLCLSNTAHLRKVRILQLPLRDGQNIFYNKKKEKEKKKKKKRKKKKEKKKRSFLELKENNQKP